MMTGIKRNFKFMTWVEKEEGSTLDQRTLTQIQIILLSLEMKDLEMNLEEEREVYRTRWIKS